MQTVSDSTSGAGTITRDYDDLDRLTSEQQPQGTVSYTYWADDRRKTMTAGNQAITNYTYFPNGELQQIARGASTVGFSYLPNDLLQATTLPGGQVETDGYDAANELTSIAYAGPGIPAGSQLTYGFDASGRPTGVWDSFARVGLPTATTANAVYNAEDQLTSWNGTANTYDLNGNLTAAGTQTYAWNARDQLTATSGGAAAFVYDGLGRRIKATISGGTTKFLYDGFNDAQEQNNSGGVSADVLTGLGPDQVYQRTVSGTSYGYLTDAMGSTVGLVAGSTLSPEYTYQVYGGSTQTGSIANPYRFTGREWDAATGLQYNRARYYSSMWGRFISEDPSGTSGDVNPYLYANASPTTLLDPFGLSEIPPNEGGPGAPPTSGGSGSGDAGESGDSPYGPSAQDPQNEGETASANLGNFKVLTGYQLKQFLSDQGVQTAEEWKAEVAGLGEEAAPFYNIARNAAGDIILVPVSKGTLPNVRVPWV